MGLGSDVSDLAPKAKASKASKCDYKTKKLLFRKRNHQHKDQSLYGLGENTVNLLSYEGLVASTYKELIQLSYKKTRQPD